MLEMNVCPTSVEPIPSRRGIPPKNFISRWARPSSSASPAETTQRNDRNASAAQVSATLARKVGTPYRTDGENLSLRLAADSAPSGERLITAELPVASGNHTELPRP